MPSDSLEIKVSLQKLLIAPGNDPRPAVRKRTTKR